MLRFRNRFKGSSSTLHTCGCGLRVTISEQGGRPTIIHELPWCERFEGMMKRLQAEPDSQLHQALIVGIDQEVETILMADGDSTGDVDTMPDLRSRGDA